MSGLLQKGCLIFRIAQTENKKATLGSSLRSINFLNFGKIKFSQRTPSEPITLVTTSLISLRVS